MNETFSPLSHLNLHKSIHSHSTALFRYSNSLGRKSDEKKIHDVDTKDESEFKPLDALEDSKKLGLFARFKKMAKDYWYVLIPVHVVTSIGWFGAGYYTSVR